MQHKKSISDYLPFAVCMVIAVGLVGPRLPILLSNAVGLRAMIDPLAAQEAKAKAADQIAQQHYQSGCQMLITRNSQGKPVFAAIPIGQPAINASTGLPFAEHTVFCDHTGTTVLVQDSIFHPDTVAFARDRTVIHAAMQRYQGVQYEAPVAATQDQ